MTVVAPYGSWKSPITADVVTAQVVSLVEAATDGDDVYWVEGHPEQGGRQTIMRRTPDGSLVECLPPEFYARTTVHEYGGGMFTVRDGAIYFANYRDQHLYSARVGEQPRLLTPGDGYRFADMVVDRGRRRLICIREDHTGGTEAANTIVAVRLDGDHNGDILVEGNDFYSDARLSPDGSQLAYLTWNHPNMPWDGCELWLTDVGLNGSLTNPRRIAGGPAESVCQPEWSPEGVLHFVAESSGWWNLYRWQDGKLQALCPMQAEFAKPQWVFGRSSYCFVSPERMLCSYSQDGTGHLAWLDTQAQQLTPVATSYTEVDCLRAGKGFAIFIAGSPTEPTALVRMDTTTGEMERIRLAFEASIDPGYFSLPQSITYPSDGGRDAHAMYYPPTNKDCAAPRGERPPVLVMSHGGPTDTTGTSLRYAIQYWTSRGFALLDVNYGGSTGYGREYRQRLNGSWGVVDVADCCNGARYLVEKGLADPNRLAIRGGSAGGYTTLACLAFRNEVFKAGASRYGLSDLETMAKDSHKFESRYLNSLVGPYPARKDIYFDRSPIHFVQHMSVPIILFQGDEDKIVPPAQSQMMFDALRRKGLPVAYLSFPGEGHGFRRSENIRRALEAELYFYGRIFGFRPADAIEPVPIENL